MLRCSNGRCVFLGDPVVDILADVAEHFLQAEQLQAGGCKPVNAHKLQNLLSSISASGYGVSRCAGGSAANSAKALASLTSRSVSFTGMVGSDDRARTYREGLANSRVQPRLVQSTEGSPTAVCLCMVTGEGERTMRTDLAAAAELQRPEQLPQQWADDAAVLHLEGYSLYRPAVAEAALRTARKQGAIASLDLASFELVQHCHSALQHMLQHGLLDLVFCNCEEAKALAEVMNLPQTEESGGVLASVCSHILKHSKVCIISLGAEGCMARDSLGTTARACAAKVSVVDTVGAGDALIAGFLHAYISGATLQACVECGCAAGSAAVQCAGSELQPKDACALKSKLEQIMASHACEP